MAYTTADLGATLPLLASGKVRELYEVDSKTLLFVASDRISAYDVIMKNVKALSICMLTSNIRINHDREFQTRAKSSLS